MFNFDLSKVILILLFFILIRQSTTNIVTRTVLSGLFENKLILNTFDSKLSQEHCINNSKTSSINKFNDHAEFSCFLNRLIDNESSISKLQLINNGTCPSNSTTCPPTINNGTTTTTTTKKTTKEEKKHKHGGVSGHYDFSNQKGLFYYSFDANGTLTVLKHQSSKPLLNKTEALLKDGGKKLKQPLINLNNNSSNATTNQTVAAETVVPSDYQVVSAQILDYQSNIDLLESLVGSIKKQLKMLTKNQKILKRVEQKLQKAEKVIKTKIDTVL